MQGLNKNEERKMRLEKTYAMLKNLGSCDYVTALGKIAYEFGLTREKAADYLTTLKQAGKIKIVDGRVIA